MQKNKFEVFLEGKNQNFLGIAGRFYDDDNYEDEELILSKNAILPFNKR